MIGLTEGRGLALAFFNERWESLLVEERVAIKEAYTDIDFYRGE